MQQEIGLHFLAFISLTAHLVLFIELSPMQKHPISRFNHFLVSFVSAAFATFVFHLNLSESTSANWMFGVFVATIVCFPLTINIQRLIRI